MQVAASNGPSGASETVPLDKGQPITSHGPGSSVRQIEHSSSGINTDEVRAGLRAR
jgi:hypothetical protein